MWLALDIGNSAVKGGFFDGPRLERSFRLPTTDAPAAWQAALRQHLSGLPVVRAGIVSVVPPRTEEVQRVVEAATGVVPEVLQAGALLPFIMAYKTPHTLGTDRLAAAAAAWTQHGRTPQGEGKPSARSVIALDAGSAVTLEAVHRDGVFLGGTIAPGPELLLRALHTGTAQLPSVPLSLPKHAIGQTTQEAIQIGVMQGFLESTRGLLHRVAEALGDAPFVVATGGWGAFLKTHLADVHHHDPHLVLRGVEVLLRLNSEAASG